MGGYFDYNATTPLRPSAKSAIMEGMDRYWENPSSPYLSSARAKNALDTARESLSGLLGTRPESVVFTGGATEANNSVIEYVSRQSGQNRVLLLSPFEHPSVVDAARHFWGDRLRFMRSQKNGAIDLEDFHRQMKSNSIGAVSVMAVNNETGVIQPVSEVAKACADSGVSFHCDASQWFGKLSGSLIPQCDFLVGCGHKFGGPKGSGFIALSGRSEGFRSQFGGGQERGRRGGTENIPSILGMVEAFSTAEQKLSDFASQATFRDQFEADLSNHIPKTIFIGKTGTRVANTSYLLLPGYENIRWVRKLDLKGFQVSTGSACSTGKTSSSPVLTALGFAPDAGRSSVRVSSWADTAEQDWEKLSRAFEEVWADLQNTDDGGMTEVVSL